MRRAFLAITGLAASTTALVVLKGSPGTSQVAQDLPADRPPVGPELRRPGRGPASPGRTPSRGRRRRPGPAGTARPGGQPAPPRTAADRAARPPPSAPAADAPARSPGRRSTTSTAPSRCRSSSSGTRIVDATALEHAQRAGQTELRSDDGAATAYSGTDGEVVRKQSANLDTVSGATETSNCVQAVAAGGDRRGR